MKAAAATPTTARRLLGAALMFGYVFLSIAAMGLMLDAGIISEQTLRFVGAVLTYSSFGLLYVGWRWPDSVLGFWRGLFR